MKNTNQYVHDGINFEIEPGAVIMNPSLEAAGPYRKEDAERSPQGLSHNVHAKSDHVFTFSWGNIILLCKKRLAGMSTIDPRVLL